MAHPLPLGYWFESIGGNGRAVMRKTLLAGIALVCLALLACSPAYARQGGAVDSRAPIEKRAVQKDDAGKTRTETKTPAKPDTARPEGTGPIAVFADLERGWKNEEVQLILRHYGKGKVAISIEGSGPTGGQFSRNQSYYLFQDLFKYTITEKFQFVQYRHVTDGRDDVYAIAERQYKRNDDGRLFKDKIYVSLRLEDDRWVVNEIKSIR